MARNHERLKFPPKDKVPPSVGSTGYLYIVGLISRLISRPIL